MGIIIRKKLVYKYSGGKVMQLNLEQKKLISAKPVGNTLIRGVAGSGKTTIAINRISFLLSNYCVDKEDNILMVTYNKALVSYIKYMYKRNDAEESQEAISFFDKSNIKESLDIINIDKTIYYYFNLYLKENKLKYSLALDRNEKRNILQNSVLEIKKQYSDVNIIELGNLAFLNEEIEWIKACNYMELEEYQNVDRIGRMSTNSGHEGAQKLLKNSKTRQAIYNLMILYDKKLRGKNLVDFSDVALMALKQAKKKVVKKYTHIIVDESQDLSRVQLEFIKCLYNEKPYSSALFVADTAQSIYSKAWIVKGRSFASIGFDMKGKSSILAKNYRTTTQIAECAYSLIEKDENIISDENFVKPSLLDKQGSYPVMVGFKNNNDESIYVCELIKRITSPLVTIDINCTYGDYSNNYNYNDIAIIARSRNQLSDIEKQLEVSKIPCNIITGKDEINFSENTIKVLTMHAIKGLEFKIVIVIGLDNKSMPNSNVMNASEETDYNESMERKLLYVGMTRATEKLYMTYTKVPSKFLGDINFKFLRMNDTGKIRRFYNVSVDEYLMNDKINDCYSDEEKVRQWFIKELKEIYNYPSKLIDIEYPVKLFSKQGLVDLVINIYEERVMVPYIFVEFKRNGVGTKDALEQLKSYMCVCPQCKYGIVTDGNEIVVIDRQSQILNDIPTFDYNMMPYSIEKFTYIDFKHSNKKYNFYRDKSYLDSVIVNENGIEEEYPQDELVKLNVYSDIAAGEPIYINDELQGQFSLPKHFIKDPQTAFIVKVKGDSMIDAGIDNGDYIVIRKQCFAENREIIAVDIDGNTTLKRYMPMGSVILLLPENGDYEPIQVSADQVNIIGVAQSVIKRC